MKQIGERKRERGERERERERDDRVDKIDDRHIHTCMPACIAINI
jgi:hypothetical protein